MEIPASLSQTLISGVYRSGSEYLVNLLHSHPEVHASMYRVNVFRFIYGTFFDLDRPEHAEAALEKIRERVDGRYGIALPKVDILDALMADRPITLGKFYDKTMSALYLDSHRRHWVEKNQLVWRQIPLFLSMMRNGRAVILVRDPRAVLASFKAFTTAPAPAYLGAAFNCLDAMQTARNLACALPPDRFLVLRNEELAKRPLETTQRVWKLIGVDTNHALLSPDHWVDAYGKPWGFNSSFQREDHSFDVGKVINGWRSYLDRDEVEFVERVCGGEMQAFGYECVRHTAATTARDEPLPRESDATQDPHIRELISIWRRTGGGAQTFPVVAGQ